MQFTSTRDIVPDEGATIIVTASVEFTLVDIDAAFDRAEADEDLFFDLYGPGWQKKTISDRLAILARVAALAEQASALNLSAGTPQPKE